MRIGQGVPRSFRGADPRQPGLRGGLKIPWNHAERDKPPSITRNFGLGRDEGTAPPFTTRRRLDPDSSSASVALSSAAMIAGRVVEDAARRH